MKKMKKLFTAILFMVFAFALVACSGKKEATDTTSEGTEKTENTTTEQPAEEPAEEGIKVGVSAPDLTNVFFIQIKDARKQL